AVFGNVGSMLCFQVGATDAELLAKQLGGDVTENDLMNLPKFTDYLRLLIDGLPSRPFSMTTLEPAKYRQHRADAIRRASHQRFGRSAAQIELELQAAYGGSISQLARVDAFQRRSAPVPLFEDSTNVIGPGLPSTGVNERRPVESSVTRDVTADVRP